MPRPNTVTPKFLTHAHKVAVAWLRGEDSYQFGKFPHSQDVGYLQEPMRVNVWGAQFGSNTRRAELFAAAASDVAIGSPDRVQLMQKALQAAGKVAATGRGLYVVVSRLAEPDTAAEMLREQSFALLEATDPAELAQGVYTQVPDVWQTPLGEALDELDAHLERPVSAENVGSQHVGLANRVYVQASSLLLDKLIAWAPEDVLMPRPGVPSGTIEPWITYPG